MSYPGYSAEPLLLAVASLFVMGILWAVRLVGSIVSKPRQLGWRWLIAPAVVIVTALLVVIEVPLRVRFGLSRNDFDAVVADLPPRGTFDDWAVLDVPATIGSYRIVSGWQVGNNVILYESNGLLFDDAGFAYLPNGVDDRLGNGAFEAPTFENLGGGWYAWHASW
jgi:hypothetical protein